MKKKKKEEKKPQDENIMSASAMHGSHNKCNTLWCTYAYTQYYTAVFLKIYN